MLQKIFDYAKKKYHSEPEYLWARLPEAAVLRNQENQKWYAVFMKIMPEKIGLKGKDLIPIMDLKCDPMLMGSFLQMPGYYPGYHMNKTHWMTVLLDGTIEEEQLLQLLDMSYHLTEKRKKS